MTEKKFIYPEAIAELRAMCARHIDGTSSADDLQKLVQRAEAEIIAVEEKDVRAKMTDVESKLELVKFTVESDQQVSETKRIASDLVKWLSLRERGSPS